MIGALNTALVGSVGGLEEEIANWISRIKWTQMEQQTFAMAGEFGLSEETLGAANEFIIALKTNNIIDKIKRCNLFCGDHLTAALHPIIVEEEPRYVSEEFAGFTFSTWDNTSINSDKSFGFYESDYNSTQGLSATRSTVGETAQQYLEMEAFLSSVDMNERGGHLSVMCDNSMGSEYMMPICGGNYSDSSTLSAFIEFGLDGFMRAASPSSLAQGSTVGYVKMDTPTRGDVANSFWLANRISTTDQKLYKDGQQYDNSEATADQSSYPIGGYKFRVFGAYSNGQITQTSDGRMLFYSLGEGLSESEILILNDALLLFNTKIGRV